MRWKDSNGRIVKHPRGHHGHTLTGQPVYHEPEDCLANGYPGAWRVEGPTKTKDFHGQGDNHHVDLDHQHEEV